MPDLFTPDAAIATAAKGLADKAVVFARERCGVTLDWSEDSVARVEQVLQTLHEQMPTSPPDQPVLEFSRLFGSYLGELYRRNHGAAWGIVDLDGVALPGLKADNDVVFRPWTRAQKRILEGPVQSVTPYYRELVRPPTLTA